MEQAASPIVELQEVIAANETKSLWVFGYGSLCWNPGFAFDKAVMGHIQGYSRKFWQGNNTHRGTEQKVNIIYFYSDKDHCHPKLLLDLNSSNFYFGHMEIVIKNSIYSWSIQFFNAVPLQLTIFVNFNLNFLTLIFQL